MLPPLRTVKAGLQRVTEALAVELARPGTATPRWDRVEWRLATAAATAHGVSALLERSCRWEHVPWQRFLRDQRVHVEHRQRRIRALLDAIDAGSRAGGIALVPLKGSALQAAGLYAPGDRPMADIDLLVRDADQDVAIALLQSLGYVPSYAQWKHRVFKPAEGAPWPGLGEHRDTPVNIELHVRIQERLPVRTADITDAVFPRNAHPGLNEYASIGALMGHLLLHAAGGVCSRSLRLMHLHDIALLSKHMDDNDWAQLGDGADRAFPWWAFPPLRLVQRYYPGAIPPAVLARAAHHCPLLLRALAGRRTMTAVSCSELWLHPLAGLEWARSAGDVARYLRERIRPSRETLQERADMLRTQLWLQDQAWVRMPHRRRVLHWLAGPVPRMDTLHVVRAAMDSRALVP
jgi:hypothetical protein